MSILSPLTNLALRIITRSTATMSTPTQKLVPFQDRRDSSKTYPLLHSIQYQPLSQFPRPTSHRSIGLTHLWQSTCKALILAGAGLVARRSWMFNYRFKISVKLLGWNVEVAYGLSPTLAIFHKLDSVGGKFGFSGVWYCCCADESCYESGDGKEFHCVWVVVSV